LLYFRGFTSKEKGGRKENRGKGEEKEEKTKGARGGEKK